MWSTGRLFFYAGSLLAFFWNRVSELLIYGVQLCRIILIGDHIGKSVIVAVLLRDAVQHAELLCQRSELGNIRCFDLQHFSGNTFPLEPVRAGLSLDLIIGAGKGKEQRGYIF